jgi:hypothetical protein
MGTCRVKVFCSAPTGKRTCRNVVAREGQLCFLHREGAPSRHTPEARRLRSEKMRAHWANEEKRNAFLWAMKLPRLETVMAALVAELERGAVATTASELSALVPVHPAWIPRVIQTMRARQLLEGGAGEPYRLTRKYTPSNRLLLKLPEGPPAEYEG